MDAEKIQVLLVEDNPTDAMLVKDELAHTTGAKFSVVHLEHLHEALARLAVQRFDVVLLDLSLPDAHGFETFVRLHDAVVEIPIVVLSGRADEQLAIKAVQAGAQDYLVKGRLGENVLERALRYAIERQRVERTLAQSEERYRLLIEHSPNGYLVHCDGEIVFANAASLKMFGADRREQLVGRSIMETVKPEFHPVVRQRIQNSESDGNNAPIEIHCLRLDGTTVIVEGASNPFLHEGRPAVQVMLRDLTERNRLEARFRWLIDSNAQGVMFWNTQGAITVANNAFLRIAGYSREELEAGRLNWERLTPPEYAHLDQQALVEIGIKGFCTPYEKEFIRGDGERISILIGASVFEDAPEEGVAFILDLTERNRFQQKFYRAQRMESIGTLAGGIAHDLNNTLTPIMLSIEVLKIKFPDAESLELLETISTSASHAADMVRQVLSFARGVEGRRMEVQVKHLLKEIEKIVTDTFPKNIHVKTAAPYGLWTVIGDPTQLHQVLLNLCVNARDAMPGGGDLAISAENRTLDAHYAALLWNVEAKAGPYICLQVTDNGTGMPPDLIEKIFDPFFTTKELGKGTGLGLSTSMAILKSHGGFVQVQSELGKGTTFSVYLPAQTEVSPEAAAVMAAEMPRGNGELILVVDDEPTVRDITQQTLEVFGYRVLLASNGVEAVAIYARQGSEIAAVLTDMMMPVMDGPATILVLRGLNPAVRIIGTSGLAIGSQAPNLNIGELLPKPFTAETLLKALKQVLAPQPVA